MNKYPNPTELPAAKHTSAPVGCPDIAFTAELDGKDTLILDESNPILNQSAPADFKGKWVQWLCPNTTANTVPVWFQQQLRVGCEAQRHPNMRHRRPAHLRPRCGVPSAEWYGSDPNCYRLLGRHPL